MVVLLPAPFGPSSAKVSPRPIVKSMPRSASKPPRYALRNALTSTTDSDVVMVPGWTAPRGRDNDASVGAASTDRLMSERPDHQRHRDREHHHGDQAVQDAPRDRAGED